MTDLRAPTLDPTRVVAAQEDVQILIGATAQLSCFAEYDKSFSHDFELLWEKDDVAIGLNHTENSRCCSPPRFFSIYFYSVTDRYLVLHPFCPQVLCGGRCPPDRQREPRGPGRVHVRGENPGGPRLGLDAAHGAW